MVDCLALEGLDLLRIPSNQEQVESINRKNIRMKQEIHELQQKYQSLQVQHSNLQRKYQKLQKKNQQAMTNLLKNLCFSLF